MESRGVRILVRAMSGLVLVFLYSPLAIVIIYAFNRHISQVWPPDVFTTRWFSVALHDADVRRSLVASLEAGLAATGITLVLGSAAAFAVHRFRFFGRETVSFVVVLPIALPGIVTAVALSSAIDYVHSVFPPFSFSLYTVIIGHATFCVVVVYNNVLARLRRTPTSLVEASMDLGGDGWQTFRYVTLPNIRTALLAGGILAFGLSFDEIVVTVYTAGNSQTLPLWIFNHIRGLPEERPVVNVVAMVVLLLSLIPVYVAQRLTGGEGVGRPAGGEATPQPV